jgi:DNA invertase Pin-like site-specific DNA recombinase
MKEFAYIRVSDKDQNEARQLEAIKHLSLPEGHTFIDKQSGKDFDRPEWQLLKRVIREGDTLYVKELDRLGRNAEAIKEEWNYITNVVGADIVVLDMPVLDTRKKDDSTDMQKLITNIVLELLAFMAQKEREKIKTRQAEGIAVAQAQGKHMGRPVIQAEGNFNEAYTQWKSGSITARKAMEMVGMKPNTFYRRVKEYESQLT